MDLPKPPEDQELKNIIDKLANFVARNGPEFEHLTKQKQKDNPKFSFLFGGEHFNYYQYKVTTEQAILNQQKQKLSQAVTGLGLSGAPWTQPGGVITSSQPISVSSSIPPAGLAPNLLAGNMPPSSSAMPPASVIPANSALAQTTAALALTSAIPQGSGLPPSSVITTIPPSAGVTLTTTNPIAIQLQEQLRQQQENANEQIKNSEQNLAAQYQSLMAQQQMRVEEAMAKLKEDKIHVYSKECGIAVEDMEAITHPIIESCTKDAISNGKNWIFTHHQVPKFNEMISEYLKKRITAKEAPFELRLHLIYLINDVLHHCQRKNAEDIRKCVENVVVPIFCTAYTNADEDKKVKLSKLLSLWQQNKYFDAAIMEQMKDAPKALAAYKAAEMTEQATMVAQIQAEIQQRYSALQKQHQDFVAHVKTQLAQQQANVHQQIAALQPPSPASYTAAGTLPANQLGGPAPGQSIASTPQVQAGTSSAPPMGMPNFPPPGFPSGPPPDFSIPPPGFPPPGAPGPFPPPPGGFPLPDFSKPPPGFPPPGFPPQLPCEADLTPSVPYFELPAGLMAPLVKLEDNTYKSLDPKDIRLPPPMPPSERLLAAVEAFYSMPSHERPRDAEGWEKLGLFEFFKAKTRARKMKEAEMGRERSRSRSRSVSRSPPPVIFRKRRYSERRHKSKSPSRSPTPDRSRRSQSRSRSTSQSPVRQKRSPSRSPTPPGFAMNEPFHTNTMTQKLGAENKGHQLLKKMGWGGGGLGSSEQGMTDPVAHAEVRDRTDMYKGIGINLNDPFEQFRKSKSAGFIQRMKAREEAMKPPS